LVALVQGVGYARAAISKRNPYSNRMLRMVYDPDEIVSLHSAQMTLKTAVAKVMALPLHERATATIFRTGVPTILDAAQIETIARLPGFENSN
jgi:hypothetical protein